MYKQLHLYLVTHQLRIQLFSIKQSTMTRERQHDKNGVNVYRNLRILLRFIEDIKDKMSYETHNF